MPDSGSVYLSFLPENAGGTRSDGIGYCCYELDAMVVVELWAEVSEKAMRFDLLSDSIGFWQVYQLEGSTAIYFPHRIEVDQNRCLPFATRRDIVSMQWEEGKCRLLLVGYKRSYLPDLLAEYPSLKQLATFYANESPLDLLLPDIGIHARFRDILLQIQQLTYRSFHTRFELGVALGLLFQELHLGIQRASEPGARSQLGLYHQALSYISKHFAEEISKESIAAALAVSSRTLNRAFEGRPVKIADYIQRLKLNKARELLFLGEMTVEEVANELNFPNRKYFSREFKKYFFDCPSTIMKA